MIDVPEVFGVASRREGAVRVGHHLLRRTQSRPVACVLVSLTGVLISAAIMPAAAQAQEPRMPSVRGRFLPDAIEALNQAGYQNIEVVHQVVDDMPADVVIGQYPEPDLLPRSTPVLLVVVRPLGVLTDLRGWRADHALFYLEAMDLPSRLLGQIADPSQAVVVLQQPPPGPIIPGTGVVLTVRPLPAGQPTVDTVVVTLRDTTRVTDTFFVQGPAAQIPAPETIRVTEPAGPWGDLGLMIPVAGVITLLGGGLGFVGCRAMAGRPGPRRPAVSGEEPPEAPGSGRGLDLPHFSAVITDEAIVVGKGDVHVRRDQGTNDV